MSISIMRPVQGADVYNHAAKIFCDMYEKVTGIKLNVLDADDGISDLFVIGSDAVNDFLMNDMLEGFVGSLDIRYGTDDYCIHSYEHANRKILVLAGGRGRSTLYAVYDYFERFAGCHYFWDGDIIGNTRCLPMENIHIVETPRFEYRGLRYFAHRGLKRFQAEHWSFEDWKHEIDWMVKKRLNFFMLRIGMDDVWQRAFPKEVPYPEDYRTITGADADGYDDRSDFWTLEYRGKLRERILEYARSRDIVSPVDCGTMTHWYSRTPTEFLETAHPHFLPQEGNNLYVGSDTGKVWDFRRQEEMNNYMRLTETMVNEYDKSDALFHTIGLGERSVFADKEKNFRLKLLAYRRIAENLRKRYPNSKLMLASWDFYFCWTPEEVQGLIKELDPERTIILDYTSEGANPDTNFTSWGVVGKFPWIFGLFHAYEPDSELRGAYDAIESKLKIAVDDSLCKGMVLWPELSHSDPIVLEYLTQNAWIPLRQSVEEMIKEFCIKRYGEFADQMNSCWQTLLPFIKLGSWNSQMADKWCRFTTAIMQEFENNIPKNQRNNVCIPSSMLENVVSTLQKLMTLDRGYDCEMIMRDAVDMARTIVGRFLNYLIKQAVAERGCEERISEIEKHYDELLDVMEKLLCLNNDFSIYHSLVELRNAAPVNSNFELTLKRNIYNDYCTQPAYELTKFIFKPEAKIAFDWLKTAHEGIAPDFEHAMSVVINTFMKTPLETMQPKQTESAREVFAKAVDAVAGMKGFINDGH